MSVTTTATSSAVSELEQKATSTSPDVGLLGVDDQTGVVEALVSVTGIVDHDGDVIMPGAYVKTLKNRRPKGIFVHDWAKWVARTEHIEELMPGDARLPKATKDGKAWPREAGGLYVKARFNLATSEGKDAYENVKFFSETGECEWSVGYRVPTGKSTKGKDGVRHIKEMDLYEYSPVLFGANSMSGTLAVKSLDTEDDANDPAEEKAEWLERLHPRDNDGQFSDGPGGGGGTDWGQEFNDFGDLSSGNSTLLDDWLDDSDIEALDRITQMDWEDEMNDREDEQDAEDRRVRDRQRREESQRAGKTVTEEGEEKTVSPFLQADHMPLDSSLDAELTTLYIPRSMKRSDRAALRTAFWDVSDALNAHGDLGLAKASLESLIDTLRDTDNDPVIQSFTANARDLVRRVDSLVNRMVDSTPILGNKPATELGKAMAHESLDRSPKANWVEKAGKLPAYIQHIAKDIHEKRGLPLSQTIPIAIAAVKKWAAGGDDVNPDTRAKAAKAVAEWEKLKASSHKKDAEESVESTLYPYLPGTYEELREQIRRGASKTLADVTPGLSHVEVLGTWPGHAVVTAYTVDPDGTRDAKSFEMPYMVTVGDGPETVTLLEPELVQLTVSVDDSSEAGEKMLPFPSQIEDVTVELKALLEHGETKAGRVLSGLNERRLLGAVESLVAVLKAAGLEVLGKPKQVGETVDDTPTEANTDANAYDSTAPSARSDPKYSKSMVMDPGLLARAYRIQAEAAARRG